MRVLLFIFSICIVIAGRAEALVINEIFSNPVGDDGGREWVELFNEGETPIDLLALSLSVKGGTPTQASLVSGEAMLLPKAYAIIGSTVSGITKFSQDYPTYSGALFKASISLVNTGVTSLDVRVNGSVLDSVAAYTAAKEGYSYGRVSGGGFAVTGPTPGKENGAVGEEASDTGSAQTTGTQTTIPQMSPPAPDIILYLPQEKIVVAGAPTIFSVSAMTSAKKSIDNVTYRWSFGDGGQGVGSSTVYSYFYPGRYVAYVDASNGLIAGKARMTVKVVAPEVTLSEIKHSKRGSYIEIHNPNTYELDISTWKVSIDGAQYSLPLTTIILPGITTLSGASLGFASTSVVAGSLVTLLFPNNEEVARSVQKENIHNGTVQKKEIETGSVSMGTPSLLFNSNEKRVLANKTEVKKSVQNTNAVLPKVTTSTSSLATTTASSKKDRRIAEFFRSWFK